MNWISNVKLDGISHVNKAIKNTFQNVRYRHRMEGTVLYIWNVWEAKLPPFAKFVTSLKELLVFLFQKLGLIGFFLFKHEQYHEKTCFLHMQKQRSRSAGW